MKKRTHNLLVLALVAACSTACSSSSSESGDDAGAGQDGSAENPDGTIDSSAPTSDDSGAAPDTTAPEPGDAAPDGSTVDAADGAAKKDSAAPDSGSAEDSGEDTGTTPPDDDAGVDAGVDAGTDAGIDAGTDAGTDASDAAAAPDTSVPAVINYVSGVTVSTLAGSDVAGTQDGTGAGAQFDNPTGIALDTHGNLLVTDYDSARVRLVTPGGAVSTIAAGTGFSDVFSAAVATDGTYYVGTDADDTGTKGATSGTIWRVVPLGDGGIATPTVVAQGFGRPRGLAPSAGGNLLVTDRSLDLIDELTVSTASAVVLAGMSGSAGFNDATGTSALFNSPVGAATLSDGSFLIADGTNNRIRHVATNGAVTTFAGTGVPSLVDAASCLAAGFNSPRAVAVDAAGNVYVSDNGNSVIRRISTSCTVQTLAGNGTAGFNNGTGSEAEFYGQEGIAVTPDGKIVYVADGDLGDGSAYQRVRAIAVP